MSAGNQSRPQHQSNWDWRAAGNFIGGGTGSGLLLFAAISSSAGSAPAVPVAVYVCAALALIALGLCCVWLEIGRPWRAMNVMLHVRTSWMTRESLLAPFLFGAGLLALLSGSTAALWLAAIIGMLFLYCQARILNAAKGIPAWRQPLVVPLLFATGLTEGAGMLAALNGNTPQPWLPSALLLVLMLRALLWRAYRKKLATNGAPHRALAVLDQLELPFIKIGHWALALVLLLVLMQPALAQWLLAPAGLAALAGGWLFKYTLIVRAGYNQGYALAQTPVRGGAGPSSGLASKPGWNKF